jgi:hypothetical protein
VKFNETEFRRFLCSLKIETKEKGIINLGHNLMGTQDYLIREIASGLNDGIHFFIVLKGRQEGITTVTLAFDMYWHFKYPGTSGTLIIDSEENREMFRTTLSMYMDSLPNQWKAPVRVHNRSQLVLANRSRIAYQVAGQKKKEKRSVGVGKAIMYGHFTECSNWGDEGALVDIQASLAEHNPRRLYIWESTARGYGDQWHEMYETAERARTQKALFVGWWLNHFYRKEKDSMEYTVYWDGELTKDEKKWTAEVKKLYDFDIQPEQIAWWRYMNAEKVLDYNKLLENYPPTADYAFQMSGSRFFTVDKLNDRMAIARVTPFECYRMVFGMSLAETQLVDATEETADLKIWEQPKAGAHYVMGADPAYGSSEWKDQFCIQIFRCYADGMEQVAEYCTTDCTTGTFAWAMLSLAGGYNTGVDPATGQGPVNIMLNLEINGPGMAVWAEIQNMRRSVGTESGVEPRLAAVCLNIQNYLYHRPDSTGGGFAYHFKTDTNTKERMLSHFKDGFELGQILCYSEDLMHEMKKVQREDGAIEAPGRGKDDRVIAAGLCTIAWKDFFQLRLAATGVTRKKKDAKPATGPTAPLGRRVDQWLHEYIGMPRKEAA